MLRAAALRLPFVAALVVSAFLGAFLLTALAPGDSAHVMLGHGEAAYEAERRRLELDRPVIERLRTRVARALVLDFGTSTHFGLPVLPLVAARAGRTLLAGGLALGLALAVGIPAGLGSARLRSRPLRRLCDVLSLALVSLPSLVTALLLSVLLVRLDVPKLGIVVLALALPAAALVERLQASAFREVMAGSFVRAARARGLSERLAAWRHAWPLSLPPVLGVVGLIGSQLVSGSLAVEFVADWPGLGRLTYDALHARDANLAAACVAAAALLVGLVTLIADVIQAAVDPRSTAS